MKKRIAQYFKGQKLLVLPEETVNNISMHPLLKNLYITDIGYFPSARYHYIERKAGCKQNILIYCTKGEGYVIIDRKISRIRRNSVLIIPKDLPHIYGSSDEEPWDIYWFHYSGETDKCFVPDNSSITIVDVPISALPILTNLFDNIFEALSRGSVINSIIYACQCFGYFLATVLYMPYNKHGQKDKKTMCVKNCIDFMEKNTDKMLSLRDLTVCSNLSKTQLTAIFKEKTGYSPIDFFIRLKIQKACLNLDFTDMTISEVASNIGYNDQYYFSRLFKKIMGKSPSDYRKINKG
ncbi:MAG: AraC family transcriptional regulator [Bacillota bacterium]|jgi:AraC family transcriptional regulator of arabinose operon|nr:AraC family transcriptional regulator [Bacillota bacterium]NLV62828.1 AraC family transcriptional regulator [Clostridiaceae bacterium]